MLSLLTVNCKHSLSLAVEIFVEKENMKNTHLVCRDMKRDIMAGPLIFEPPSLASTLFVVIAEYGRKTIMSYFKMNQSYIRLYLFVSFPLFKF